MQDTGAGSSSNDDPADLAKDGFEALIDRKDHVVAGSSKKPRVDTGLRLPAGAGEVGRARGTDLFRQRD